MLSISHAYSVESVYTENGIYAGDIPWIVSDYDALNNAIINNKVPLPTINNSDSNKVFLKLVSNETLSFFENDNLSLQQRVEMGSELTSIVYQIMMSYINSDKLGKGDYEKEISKILSFIFKVGSKNIPIILSFVQQIPKEEMDEERKSGFKSIRSGLINVFDGFIVSIGEEKTFSKSSIEHMSKTLLNNASGYTLFMDSSLRNSRASRIVDLANKTKYEEIRIILISSSKVVKGT